LDVRPLPLHRSVDLPLSILAGVAGALYAAPAGINGMSTRRWDNVETDGLTEVCAPVVLFACLSICPAFEQARFEWY
jgi:hypothetical protein